MTTAAAVLQQVMVESVALDGGEQHDEAHVEYN
jgi:hypothetical protein